MGGEHDHVGVRTPGPCGLKHLQTEAVGHPEIGDDDVEGLGAERARRRAHSVGLPHQMTPMTEEEPESQAGGRLVVDDQDRGHGHEGFTSDASPEKA